jgi:hypothetical protein
MLYIINYTYINYIYICIYNSLSPTIATHLATTSGPSTPTGVTRNVGIPSRAAQPGKGPRSPGGSMAVFVDHDAIMML